jgi:hypothetical protein
LRDLGKNKKEDALFWYNGRNISSPENFIKFYWKLT